MAGAATATARYASLQSAYWSAFCVVMMFASVFLLDAGLTNSQIGLVVAVGGAASALAQPVVAGAADVSRVPLRVWISALAVVLGLSGAALLIPGLHWLLTAVFFGLLILGVQLVLPLVNAIGMAVINVGVPVNFGVARALGSLAFALVSAVAGRLVTTSGTMVIPLLIIVFQVATLVTAITFRFKPTGELGVAVAPEPSSPDTPTAPTNWFKFVLLLAGITLSMTSHAYINSYLFQVMNHHGGGASEMGTAMMLAALVELPPMMLWTWVAARWSSGSLLKIAGLFFAIKSILTWLATSIGAIYVAQSLQMLAFAIMVPATVYYVNRLMAPTDRVKGQAYMTMTSTLGSVIGSLTGGMLIDAAGVPTMLLVGAVVAAVGATLTVAGAERI